MHFFQRYKKILLVSLGSVFLVVLVFLGLKYLLPYQVPPLPESAVYLDRNGKEIAEIAYNSEIRHRELDFSEIPDFYKRALVELEDRSFWTNEGISLSGLARSMLANLEALKFVQGGSTITSQLVRNIEGTEKSRSLGRKALEFVYAIRLTGKYSKETILADYINRVSYGRLAFGLASAAKIYFAKDPENLTKAEQIALLLLPRNPAAYDPVEEPDAFRSRFSMLVTLLVNRGILSADEATSILAERLNYRKSPNSLPYVTDFLRKNKISPETKTSFDIDLTKHIDMLAQSVLSEIGWKNVTDYAVLVVDRATNELRVMIGWASYGNAENGQVNAALAPRQVGSTLKPFIYLLAARDLGIKANDTVLDLPVSYKTDEDYSYEPKNYSQDFKGAITYAEALAQSINIPAVMTLDRVGIQKLLDFLRTLWVDSLTDTPEHYGLSLALGSGEISLFELTQAYTIFANAGNYCPFVIVSGRPSQCEKRVDTAYVDMISSILTSRENKIRSFPINSALDFTDRKVFVKTGTSRNFRDNWSIGYTNKYIIGVWSGNKNAENMKGVSGATGAGEIFGRIVRDLEPADETLEANITPHVAMAYTRIIAPLNGSVYRIDPSRPITTQSIKLEARTNITHNQTIWYVDGQKVPGEFTPLISGEHELRYEILQNGTVVGQTTGNYRVE